MKRACTSALLQPRSRCSPQFPEGEFGEGWRGEFGRVLQMPHLMHVSKFSPQSLGALRWRVRERFATHVKCLGILSTSSTAQEVSTMDGRGRLVQALRLLQSGTDLSRSPLLTTSKGRSIIS